MEQILLASIAINELSAAPRNARRHSRQQLRKLADGIRIYGFLVPIIAERSGRIIGGHGRWQAAKMAGLTHVPVIFVDHLTAAQIESLALFENRISDDATFDRGELGLILKDILALDPGFDLELNTAFELPELDLALLESEGECSAADAGCATPDRSRPAIARAGDLFVIGGNKILCADSRELQSYAVLLDGKLAQMVLADPPFNVRVAGHVSGRGRVAHGEFAMASGEMSSEEFVAFLSAVFRLLVAHSEDGSIHFHFMDWRHMAEILAAGEPYSELINLCVWQKTQGGMGSLYRSQHELVFVFKSGGAPHINNVGLGRFGRNRTNCWRYAGANVFGKSRDGLADHPTPKSVDMIADAILDCSRRGGIILDPFLGSGTTILAAARTGRLGYGIELDPYYVDAAVRRIAIALDEQAIHAATGKTFDELAAFRSANPGWAV